MLRDANATGRLKRIDACSSLVRNVTSSRAGSSEDVTTAAVLNSASTRLNALAAVIALVAVYSPFTLGRK